MSDSPRRSQKRHGSRYRARRRAVDFLYEAESRDCDPVSLLEERIPMGRRENSGVKPVAEYTQHIVHGVAIELNTLDDAIDAQLQKGWQLDRLPAVDRAILRVAAWELLHNDAVPPLVAVTEGAELAREYSTNDAPTYIHGVLNGIMKATEQQPADGAIAQAEPGDSEAQNIPPQE